MQSIVMRTKQIFHRVAESIAFYPTLIALCLIFFAFLVMWVEFQPWLIKLKPSIDFVLVGSVEDGRLILGTLVASTISLMVFSFSMVMIVLNQASANLSPRLLPGLITVKANQIVLGFYLGTICYCLMLILNIHPSAEDHKIPSVGIFIGLCLGILCLALFTYFIHSISQSIQVDHILDRLFRQTRHRIASLGVKTSLPKPAATKWHTLRTPTPGYLKWIEHEDLVNLCQKHNLVIKVIEPIGVFFQAECPFLEANSEVSENLERELHDCFVFYPQELLNDHYSFGFKQISEIAVKALSKGINDPATAIKAIDMLMMLFLEKLKSREKTVLFDKNDEPRVFLKETSIQFLLHLNVTPIREYAKHDVLVVQRLISGLGTLIHFAEAEEDLQSICLQLQAVRCNCHFNIRNVVDRSTINAELDRINRHIKAHKKAQFSIQNLTDVSSASNDSALLNQ